jgi:glycosyltransferase involved in cell wall biosynthesis
LDFVDIVITGGKVNEAQMPDFYHSLDAIVSPSLIEGGPMCVTEGLACGVPILCYSDVGVVDEFEHGVLRVQFKDESAFVQRVKDFWANKEYDYYRQSQQIQLLRSQVETHTWENFAAEHDRIFDMVRKAI